MNIEIWSDIACPFCYIGKKRFEEALEQFAGKEDVQVVYRSFELDPNAAKDVPMDVYDMLANKYGISREQAVAMNQNVAEQAKSVGIPFHFDKMILTNTFNAHRLSHLAAEHDRMDEMLSRLFQAYFTDSLHIGDADTLIRLATEVGLDEEEVKQMLASDAYSDEVRADEQEAANLGIRGVPYFVINRKFGISGAQPVSFFLQALEKAKQEEQPLTVLNEEQSNAVCEDGTCTPPSTKSN